MTVAALFVDRRGPYWGRPDIDAWDRVRDATRYAGPHPVVAHPPCERWCALARFVASRRSDLPVGADGGTFAAALAAVRRWGGVLEHPAGSLAWRAHGLACAPCIGWFEAAPYEWTCEVWQAHYGHPCAKRTWLWFVGAEPPAPLLWGRARGTAIVSYLGRSGAGHPLRTRRPRVSHATADLTPPAFADALVSLAKSSRP